MPIFHIDESNPIFPHPSLADEHGIVGIGGNLESSTLIKAYRSGIFPWYSNQEPIIWWSPNPRFVLFPSDLKVQKSMRPYFNQARYTVTYNQSFPQVMKACQRIRRSGQEGTWITNDMYEAYCVLHSKGIAHSVEVWQNDKLAGGLYGLAIGKVFFGESMFSLRPNASKFGFISLVQELKAKGFELIDCQQETKHLASFGAQGIDRSLFLDLVNKYVGIGTDGSTTFP